MVKNPFEGLGESLRNTFNPKKQPLPSGGAWTDDAIDALNEVWGIDKTKGEMITPAPSRPKKLSAAQDANSTSTAKTDGICQECPKALLLEITRTGEQKKGSRTRTNSTFELWLVERGSFKKIKKLMSGYSGEQKQRNGDGDNTREIGSKYNLCIEKGEYYLQSSGGGKYETRGYEMKSMEQFHSAWNAAGKPMDSASRSTMSLPGILVENTGKRQYIKIHPCYNGFLSSIGCIHLWKKTSRTDQDSFNCVVELTDFLDQYQAWGKSRNKLIIK